MFFCVPLKGILCSYVICGQSTHIDNKKPPLKEWVLWLGLWNQLYLFSPSHSIFRAAITSPPQHRHRSPSLRDRKVYVLNIYIILTMEKDHKIILITPQQIRTFSVFIHFLTRMGSLYQQGWI